MKNYVPRTNITALLSQGPDAFSNIYDVAIIPPLDLISSINVSQIVGLSTTLLNKVKEIQEITIGKTQAGINSLNPFDFFRIRSLDVTLPTAEVESYQKEYKTVTLSSILPKINVNYEITIDFRVDANWDVFVILLLWRNLYLNPTTGKWSPPESTFDLWQKQSNPTLQTIGEFLSLIPSIPDFSKTKLGTIQVKAKREGLVGNITSMFGGDNTENYRKGVSDGGEIPDFASDVMSSLVWTMRGAFLKKIEGIQFTRSESNPIIVKSTFGFFHLEEPFSNPLGV